MSLTVNECFKIVTDGINHLFDDTDAELWFVFIKLLFVSYMRNVSSLTFAPSDVSALMCVLYGD